MIKCYRNTAILISLITAACFLAVISPTAAFASNEPTITVYRSKVLESYIGDNFGFTVYSTSDGRTAYDYDLLGDGPKSGTVYNLSNEWDPGIQYILDYPYTSSGDIKTYIIQSAIWEYRNPNQISSSFQEGEEAYEGIRAEIDSVVNGAKSCATNHPSKEEYYKSQILSLAYDKSERVHATEIEGITYYETPVIRATVKGAATLDNVIPSIDGVEVIDKKEVADQTLSNIASQQIGGWEFRLRVTQNALKQFIDNPTLTILASPSINTAQIYQSENNPDSKMVVPSDIENTSLELSATLDVTSWSELKSLTPEPSFPIIAVIPIVGLILAIFGISKLRSK